MATNWKPPTKETTVRERFAKEQGKEFLHYQDFYNFYNNESAQKQMDFQERMSNTAHQREVDDLLKAGLNPVLSANAGAPSMVGAYSTVDQTAGSAAAQSKLQKSLKNAEIKAQKDMNKYSVDMSYRLGVLQAQYGLAGSKYAANASAAAARFAAMQSAYASMYGADMSLTNSREQRDWDSMHPSNAWQAGGSLFSGIKGLRNSYSDSNSGSKQKSKGNQKSNKGRN